MLVSVVEIVYIICLTTISVLIVNIIIPPERATIAMITGAGDLWIEIINTLWPTRAELAVEVM